jgi:Tol biopolymer transport system component
LLFESPDAKEVQDWSPDGAYILHALVLNTGRDLWVLPLDGSKKPLPVVQSRFEESGGRFSPDGQWISFTSNESGQNEIYIQRFPGPVGKTPVSEKVAPMRSGAATGERFSTFRWTTASCRCQ